MARKTKEPINLDFLQGNGARTDLSGMFASSVSAEADTQQAAFVPIERLLNNPYQPRIEANEESLNELSQVIGAQGFQGVLVARPDPKNPGFYQLTAGHRRREASRRAGLTSLPIVVREFSNEEMATIAITENIQREDLTPLEEGKIFLLMAEEMGYTHEQVAREVGRKRGYIENRIRVARAPLDVQALVTVKPDSLRAVANLIKVKDEAVRAEIIQGMLAGTLTVEDLPGYIESRDIMHRAEAALKAASEYYEAKREADKNAGETQPLTGSDGAHQTSFDVSAQAEAQAVESASQAEQSEANSQAQANLSMRAEERSRIRIGSAKLAAALRYLNNYREQAAEREQLSRQERVTLRNIKSLVDSLHERYAQDEVA